MCHQQCGGEDNSGEREWGLDTRTFGQVNLDTMLLFSDKFVLDPDVNTDFSSSCATKRREWHAPRLLAMSGVELLDTLVYFFEILFRRWIGSFFFNYVGFIFATFLCFFALSF